MERFGFIAAELSFIESFNGTDTKYWEKEDAVLGSLKKKVRTYYLVKQSYYCCYCKMLKQESHGATWDVEHIFPRKLYPQFTFTPENFAISCKECNQPKSDQEIRINTNTNLEKYPNSGNNIKILHPNLDIYEDHMKVTRSPDGAIFHTPINNSKKARATYTMCNLIRFQEKAFGTENLYARSIENHLIKVLTSCTQENMSKEQMDLAIKIAVKSCINY